MISSIIRSQGSSRMTPAVHMAIRRFDPLEAKMAQKRAEAQQRQLQQQLPGDQNDDHVKYATKSEYRQNIQDSRYAGATGEESGQVPTKWQKRFLVITKLYPNMEAIPPFVHHGTMNRMHDRMRVVFIVTACTLFFSIFFAAESSTAARISRDKNAGVVVTKM